MSQKLSQWTTDLSISRKHFVSIVFPQIKFWFGESQLIQVEDVKNFYAELLDKEAGIDYFIKDNIGLRPISARVQLNKSYPTITIRESRTTGAITELEKLIKRVDNYYIYPWLHIQAYVRDNQLLSAYAVQTSDIVKYFSDKDVCYQQKNSFDGNTFVVFSIEKLKAKGVHVLEFCNS